MADGPLARLALVLHFHQPVGNLDDVVHRCCDRCYAPFLASLEANPDIPATLHVSGALIEWLDAHRPEIVETLARLARRGQIELQTGGYYESILAVLPPDDVRDQIALQTETVRRRFGQQPTGLWLTERIWEPHLPEALVGAGVRYVVLDDTIFRAAGVPESELVGGFETEHLGHTLRVYPGAQELRYRIPFQAPEKTLELLRAAGEREPGALLVYGDDGEKFGEWPETAKTVYGERWLERFWEALRGARDWLQLVKLGEHDALAPSRGRVYLPTASYDEMMTWTLPPQAQPCLVALQHELDGRPDGRAVRPFVRGGSWRAFFARYPESDHLHKRLLGVSARLRRALRRRPWDAALAEARRDVLRAQCNCAYWHGVFGGLYLVHLRNALWRHLIRAEAALDRIEPGPAEPGVLRSERAVAVVDGGVALEFDDRRTALDVLSVVARRPEAYHADLERGVSSTASGDGAASIHEVVRIKEGARDVVLAYDGHLRGAFVDWWLPADLPARSYGSPDWAGGARRAALGKVIRLDGATLVAEYRDVVPAAGRRAGVEVNLQLGEPGSPERALEIEDGDRPGRHSFASAGSLSGVASVVIRERPGAAGVRLRVTGAPRSDLWWFPVETVSASESGLERTPQGTSFLVLPSASSFTIAVELLEGRA